jgi:hypothetical protein
LAAAGSLAAAAIMAGRGKKQPTKNSGGNSDGNGVCNVLRYNTAFFEQSIPVWNRLSYPTKVRIQYWKKLFSLGISIFYIHM